MGGIKANTIQAIGTINPGSLCLQCLFAPQIHYDLSGEPIAFIGNSSNKKGKFTMIRINVESIRAFVYIKNKATSDTNPIHGDKFSRDLIANTVCWKDMKENVDTLIPNFFLAYFGQDLPHGDISDEEIMAKLTCLDSGYKLWANTATGVVAYIDDILTIMEEIKEPKKIKQYLDPAKNDKSLQLAMANGPVRPTKVDNAVMAGIGSRQNPQTP
jgi:hypothetical protein